MQRETAISPDHNHQLSREPFWQRDTNYFVPLVVERQRPNRYETYTHSERDQINNQIEAIQLHHRLHQPAFVFHPGAELLTRVRILVNQ